MCIPLQHSSRQYVHWVFIFWEGGHCFSFYTLHRVGNYSPQIRRTFRNDVLVEVCNEGRPNDRPVLVCDVRVAYDVIHPYLEDLTASNKAAGWYDRKEKDGDDNGV